MFCPSVFALGCQMNTPDPDIKQVKKLLELVDRHGLEELSVEEGDLEITVKGRGALQAVHPVHHPAVLHHAEAETSDETAVHEPHEDLPASEEQAPSGNIVDIVAPLVGVFYRAPSPEAAPFIEVGDEIEVGTEVGLIEAMKVFSPIPSEVAGVVVEIPGQNGKLVHEGEVLVRVQVPEEESV